MPKKHLRITRERAQEILLADLVEAQNEGKIERLHLKEAGNSLIQEEWIDYSQDLFILEMEFASGLHGYQTCRVVEREGKPPLAVLGRACYDKTSDFSKFREIKSITPYEVWIIDGVSKPPYPFVPVDPEQPQYSSLKQVIDRKIRTYNGRNEKLDAWLP